MAEGTRFAVLGTSFGDGIDDAKLAVVEKLEAWCGRGPDGRPLLSDDALLDVVSTYWLTRSATSSARMYHE